MTCQYRDCSYYNWSTWSATCGTVTRSRRLYHAIDRTTKRVGGCAGLASSCRSSILEQKTLSACKRMCFYNNVTMLGILLQEGLLNFNWILIL